MKRILFAFSFSIHVFAAQLIHAQNPAQITNLLPSQLDSLILAQEAAGLDTLRVNTLHAWNIGNYGTNLKLAIHYELIALESARKINFSNGIAKCLNFLGGLNFLRGFFPTALEYYKEYYEMEKKNNNLTGMARAEINMGSAYFSIGKYSEARKYFEVSIEHFIQLKNKKDELSATNNIGTCYLETGHYLEAMEYFLKAIDGFELQKDEKGKIEALRNAGIVHVKLGEFPQAERRFNESMAIIKKFKDVPNEIKLLMDIGGSYQNQGNLTEAEAMFEKAYKLSQAGGYNVSEAWALVNLASTDAEKGDKEKALQKYKTALDSLKKTGAPDVMAMATNLMGNFYLEDKKYKEAIQYLQLSLDTCIITGSNAIAANNYRALAAAWDSLNNPAMAYKNLLAYVTLNDSLFSPEKNADVSELLTKYHAQKNEKIRNQEQADYNLEIERQSKKQAWLTGGIVTFLLIAILFFGLFRLRSRSNREIELKNKEIQLQRDLVQQQNLQIREINSGLERTIAERTKNLLELNEELDLFLYESAHALRRPITSVEGLVELLTVEKDPKAIESLRGNIKFTLSRMDSMLHKLILANENSRKELASAPISISGLISSLARNFEGKNLKFEIETPENLIVHSDEFRLKTILSNLVENAQQFSDIAEGQVIPIGIKAELANGILRIIVSNMGGPIPQELHNKIFEMFFRGTERSVGNGLGLYLVKKMVERLNGHITLHSASGPQTNFILEIPVN